MESVEAVQKDKRRNEKIHGLLLCQTTEELNMWKLNEQQQQLVDASGLGSLIHTAGLSIDRSVLGVFCELWSKETNTAWFHDFEMAPSLRDTAYILGIPVTGRVVTTGTVLNKSSEELFLQYLGQNPGRKDCRGSKVKLSWLHRKFSQLHQHPTGDEIMYTTRAYLLYLIGATLFPDKDRGYVSPKYLPLLSDFGMVREYAWGAAALAHLYRGLSAIAMSAGARKRLIGSGALLMGWIYEYIPAMRPDTGDTPDLVFPRLCRWTGSVMSKPTKDIKQSFSQLYVPDVNWEPYKYMDPASIPSNCAAPDNVCFSRTWLISFNVREVYVPDRYARQFGQQQHPLNDVPAFQRHQWSASVDWSLEYASEIKHFEQLIDTAHHDQMTAATCSTTREVLAPVANVHASLGLNLVSVVENIKKELPTVVRFLDQSPLPVAVARSIARIHELVDTCHLKEGTDAVGRNAQSNGKSQAELTAPHPPVTPACKQATNIDIQHGPETAKVPNEPAPGEAVPDGDDPMPECCDTPMKEQDEARGGSEENVSGTPRKEGAAEWGETGEGKESGGRERQKRPRWYMEGGGSGLRRSSRKCVQAKRFRHHGGKGSVSSDPIVL